jgi:hypothetical protein
MRKRQILAASALFMIAAAVIVAVLLPNRFTCESGERLENVKRARSALRLCVPSNPKVIPHPSFAQIDDRLPLRIAIGAGGGGIGLATLAMLSATGRRKTLGKLPTSSLR